MDILEMQKKEIQRKLNEKYGKRYYRIRNMIMAECHLSFDGNWEIHYANPNDNFLNGNDSLKLGFWEPKDESKGYYNKTTNTISISDWSLSRPGDWELYRVIIHELLHANGYNHGKEMSIKEDCCLGLLKKKYMFPIL